jgi:DMSO/TMAO reductase YedYZ molybdopterin-dependent catalytic subunit
MASPTTAAPEVSPVGPEPTRTDPYRREAAIAGTVAAALALGVGELVSALDDSWQSLVVSVANVVKDHAPEPVTKWAIDTFGTADKVVLIIGTIVICLLVGFLVGPAARKRPWVAWAAFGAFGVVGIWAGATDPLASTAGSVFTAIVSVLVGAGTLRWLLGRLPPLDAAGASPAVARAEPIVTDSPTNPAATRRQFFTWAGAAGVAAVGAAGMARVVRGPSRAEQARQQIVLTNSTDPAGLPVGLERDVDGLSSLITPISPNDDFYLIDTALIKPEIVPAQWQLDIIGMVDRPYSLSYQDLLDMATEEFDITLSCVSNQVGGDLVGNARWTGVRLGDVLNEAGVQSGATQVVGRSVDGWTAGFPTEAVYDGRPAIIAVGMNGEPLPIRHGFPARLVIAGLYGYVSATKWVNEIELTTWEDFDGYWIPRGWSKEGPIKTQSRIDVPRSNSVVSPGVQPIAGVAWAGIRGIEKVEVQIVADDRDDGPWVEARLGEELATTTWRQWVYEWEAEPGQYTIRVRATDGDGETQTEERATPDPDGATGWDSIAVEVG